MSLERDYEGKCLTCKYYSDYVTNKKCYQCNKGVNSYQLPNFSCRHYTNARRSENQLRANMSRLTRFYVITRIMNILNVTEDNYIFKVLLDFNDNILRNSDKYYEFIEYYDQVGLKLAEKLETSGNKYILSAYYYYNFLKPMSVCIVNQDYDNAFSFLHNMLNDLCIIDENNSDMTYERYRKQNKTQN